MVIGNVSTRNFATVMKRVEESLSSNRDRDGSNHYYRQKKDELPEDVDELLALVTGEIDKMKSAPCGDERVHYIPFREGNIVMIIVEGNDGNEIRRIEPGEFFRIVKAPPGGKGNIVNSIT